MWHSTLKNTKTEEDVDDPGLVPIIKTPTAVARCDEACPCFRIHLSQQNWRRTRSRKFGRRVIRPTLKAHGLVWKGWQAYRRGLATNLKELGAPDITIQCIFE